MDGIKENFKRPSDVIKTTIRNEKIRFEGLSENAICFGPNRTRCTGLTYLIELDFKEGKFKFTPLNLSYSIHNYNISLDKNPPFYRNNGMLKQISKDCLSK
tara:strand:+ start:1723 stop:2025 length:303 start_codon:yes stop_codon:yes gene_type:complete